MKYWLLIIMILMLLLSCSEPPSRYNPYDLAFDLPMPYNLQVEHISLSTNIISWDYDYENIEGFKIVRKHNDEWCDYMIAAADTNTFNDENTPGNMYIQYKIIAFAGDNRSDELISSQIIDNMIPVPYSFNVQKVNTCCYDLTWQQDHIIGEDGYLIERKIEDGEFEQIVELGADVEYYQDNWQLNCRDVNTVTYKIMTIVNSYYSNSVEADAQILNSPSNITYQQLSINRIELVWQDNSEWEDGFRIDKKVGNSNWAEGYAVTGENITNWIDENAEFTETLIYRIYAYEGGYLSNSVQTEIFTTIPAPFSLTLNIEDNVLILSWEYDSFNIDGFRIEKKDYGDDWELYSDNISSEIRTWTDSNFSNMDSYRVRAFYLEYESGYSNVVMYGDGMIFVEGGSFDMGDHFYEGESYELPVHEVTVSSFYIGQYEVTQGEYEALMGSNPAHDNGVGDDFPVYYVDWYDAVEYCNALSEQIGFTPCYNLSDWSCDFNANGYRLPTEAEWEYAVRGGVNWTDNYKYSGTTDDLDNYAWFGNSGGQTHEVGSKLPNQLEIYNMSGNVFEWCNDWFSTDYYQSSSADNPTGPDNGSTRVRRGGSWYYNALRSRCAFRGEDSPTISNGIIGFRLTRAVD
jgi:formylglycine-generating enzyme required for sulfatase activity